MPRKLSDASHEAVLSTKISRNRSKELEFAWTPSKIQQRDAERAYYRDHFLEWAETHAKIVDRDAPRGATLVTFKAAPSQLSFLALRDEVKRFNLVYSARMHEVDPSYPVSDLPVEVVCLKARKVFISTVIQFLGFHKCEFESDSHVLTLAHRKVSAQNIAAMSRRVHEKWDNNVEVPLRTEITRCQDDLVQWAHGSKMTVMTAGSDNGVSRGFTYHFLHLSEASSYPNAGAEVANAEQACATFREIYTESTANGIGNYFHDEWENAMWIEDAWHCLENDKPFPEKWNRKFRWFWAWHQDPNYRIPCLPHEEAEIKRTLTDKERHLMEEFGCDYSQLKWRRTKIKGECSKQRDMPPEDYFCQEYPSWPEEAFVSKGGSVFDRMELRKMLDAAEADPPIKWGHLEPENIFDPDDKAGDVKIWTFKPCTYEEGATMFFWEDPIPGDQYVIGADVVEGVPWGDWAVVTVFDRTDGTYMREVARLIIKCMPEELAEMIVYLAKWYNDAYVCCERNKDGAACNVKMVNMGYPHLYHGRDEERFSQVENAKSFTAGFITSPKTKRLLVSRGVTAVKDKLVLIRSSIALKQWLGFKRLEDGAYGCEDGQNDDCVIADLLAIWGDEEGPPVMGKVLEKAKLPTETTPAQEHRDWLKERLQKIIERDRNRNRQNEEDRMGLADVDVESLLFD